MTFQKFSVKPQALPTPTQVEQGPILEAVKSHTRTSTKGKKHSVKAHKRQGEKTKFTPYQRMINDAGNLLRKAEALVAKQQLEKAGSVYQKYLNKIGTAAARKTHKDSVNAMLSDQRLARNRIKLEKKIERALGFRPAKYWW